MAHKLHSSEIRQMYDLLYKYELKLKNVQDKQSISIVSLDPFLNNEDIYIDTISKAHEENGRKHAGYILFMKANDSEKNYWLIKRIRDAFAHGYIKYENNGNIKIKDGEKKIKGEIPRSLFKTLIKLLNKESITTN